MIGPWFILLNQMKSNNNVYYGQLIIISVLGLINERRYENRIF